MYWCEGRKQIHLVRKTQEAGPVVRYNIDYVINFPANSAVDMLARVIQLVYKINRIPSVCRIRQEFLDLGSQVMHQH